MDRETIERARGIDLPAFIELEAGLVPQKQSNNGIFYISPFRTENVPSLHVSCQNGIWLWFDHGTAERKGGDAIEFVRKLRQCSFKEAVDILLDFNGVNYPNEEPSTREETIRSVYHTVHTRENNSNKINKIIWVKNFYQKLPDNYNTTIKKYFSDRGLKFHKQIACKVHLHFNDGLRYIVFPLPNPDTMRGLELREICNLEKELSLNSEEKKRRKNYGVKTLWVFKRDTSRMLITESIIDALAGEVILDDYNISLAALNGVGQVYQIDALMNSIKPKSVLLAIDKDSQGKEAKKIATEILRKNRIKFEIMKFHEKDLFRELHAKSQLTGTGTL